MNKIRFLGCCTALGTLVVLGGCVAVPAGHGVYSDDGYGYGYGYPAPVYADPGPVVVAPPVYIGGGYSHGPRYYGGRPGYYGHGPRPGWGARPGFVPPPVARPGFVPRAVVPLPHPGIPPRNNIRPFRQDPAGGS